VGRRGDLLGWPLDLSAGSTIDRLPRRLCYFSQSSNERAAPRNDKSTNLTALHSFAIVTCVLGLGMAFGVWPFGTDALSAMR
jgi:hypothetical protein